MNVLFNADGWRWWGSGVFTIAHEICICWMGVHVRGRLMWSWWGRGFCDSHSRTIPYSSCGSVDCCVDYLTLKLWCAVQITDLPQGVFLYLFFFFFSLPLSHCMLKDKHFNFFFSLNVKATLGSNLWVEREKNVIPITRTHTTDTSSHLRQNDHIR